MRYLIGFCFALLVASCSSDDSKADRARCQKAYDQLFDVIVQGNVGPKERPIIETVKKQSIEDCVRNGLTEAQTQCMLAVKTPDDLSRLIECPAIRDSPIGRTLRSFAPPPPPKPSAP